MSFKYSNKPVYLTLVEYLITNGILDWGGVYDDMFTQFQTRQNTIVRIASKRNQTYIYNQIPHTLKK